MNNIDKMQAARDCAVCGARIPGTPVYEIAMKQGKFPMCEHCADHDDRTGHRFNTDMIRRRIASGAYKVVPDKKPQF